MRVENKFTLFNAKMIEFVDDLSNLFPDLHEFKLMRTAIGLANNSSAVQKIFHATVVVPYQSQINTKDETFFLNKEYAEVEQYTNIVNVLKTVWVKLSTENKDAVWKHLQLLMYISCLPGEVV